ncbi:hypothetical protein BOTBODRAFT_27673 [Botryobasidium botryosum FD-172 SS1]|uniref:Uncharacterized protein n=1 Tax=Botryobasidium botryosum (strain FD-172 SS1) TaxID=930990 RepID=A0A067N814_BOTB1|nr:hypothetical protein BOTBODRAFT_27673 [Botryobasidium botryosum FD-172 SS1]
MSPTAMLTWGILSVILFVFLICHLWRFDRFKCLGWGSLRGPGAFKRVMTYSYILSTPLIMLYGIVSSYIKYQVGYIWLPHVGAIPTPYPLWDPAYQRWFTPLYIALALAWGLEIVSHLEELNFWLFLLNQGPNQKSWFHSYYFKSWVIGSLLAVLGIPAVTIATRSNPLMCEAWTFFAGSLGSLVVTLWFLRVLWLFPGFLRRTRDEGAEYEVLVRLTTYHELNVIRMVFRFMFVLPLLTLATDGINGIDDSHHAEHLVNESPFATDLLSILAGIGCIVSSIITLLVFFPRSIAQELTNEAVTRSRLSQKYSVTPSKLYPVSRPHSLYPPHPNYSAYSPQLAYSDTDGSGTPSQSPRELDRVRDSQLPYAFDADIELQTPQTRGVLVRKTLPTWGMPELNYNDPRDVRGERGTDELPETPRGQYAPGGYNTRRASGSLHPYILSYTSPIDLGYGDHEGGPSRPS